MLLQPAQPGEEQEVAGVGRHACAQKRPLRVRRGGHSRFCSGDSALMLDLAAHFSDVTVSGDMVTVQGGAGVGAVLQALAPHDRMVPVGTHATPGFGLLTMGGIGHLSRSFGLTLDWVEAFQGVRADGERFEIRADQADGSEIWRLLRGAAPPPREIRPRSRPCGRTRGRRTRPSGGGGTLSSVEAA